MNLSLSFTADRMPLLTYIIIDNIVLSKTHCFPTKTLDSEL